MFQTCQLWYFLEKISTRLHQLPQSLYVLHILTPRSVNRLPRSQHFRPWQLPCFRYFAMIITYEYRCNKSLTNYLGRLLQKNQGTMIITPQYFFPNLSCHHEFCIIFVTASTTLVLPISKPHHSWYTHLFITVLSYGKTSNIQNIGWSSSPSD